MWPRYGGSFHSLWTQEPSTSLVRPRNTSPAHPLSLPFVKEAGSVFTTQKSPFLRFIPQHPKVLPCFVSVEQEIWRERKSGKELILQKDFKLHGNSTPERLSNTCFVAETWIPWWTRNQRGGCTSRSQYHQDWKEKIIKSDDYLQQKKLK